MKSSIPLMISGALLTVALLLAGIPETVRALLSADYVPLAASAIFCALAASTALLKRFVTIDFTAKQTVEYIRNTARPAEFVLANTPGLETASALPRQLGIGLGKTMGNSVLFVSKAMDAGIAGVLGFAGLAFIVLSLIGATGLETGLLIVALVLICAAALLFLQFSNAALGLAKSIKIGLPGMGNAPPGAGNTAQVADLKEYSKSIGTILVLSSALMIVALLLNSLAWWAAGKAFGIELPFAAVLLVFSSAQALALIPATRDGIGVFEFVAVLAFAVLKQPMAAALALVLAWEVLRHLLAAVADISLSLAPRSRPDSSLTR